jgi:hypothetical protein
MSTNEKLRIRLQEMAEQRKRETVHPKECKCGGHGNLPMPQFSSGYVKCVT